MRKLTLALAFMVSGFAISAHALELVTFARTCKTLAGETAPLRQTIVILDESVVQKGDGAEKGNLIWKRALLEIADLVEGASNGNLDSHERLTIYVARRDGSELAPVFSGCSPNISTAQRQALDERSSFLDWVFTGGPAKALQSNKSDYKDALADATAEVLRAASADTQKGSPGSLLRAMATASRLVDLSFGIPRVVVISPLDLGQAENWNSVREAKAAGFELGAKTALDLERAEVHIVVLNSVSNQYLRPFSEALFLQSRGLVIGWRTEGLPQLPPAPTTVRVFGGVVQIGDVPAPVQIRVAFDTQGTLVNSWIEVTTGRSLATPISGKAICQSTDNCEIEGDGTLMGQAWNPDPREEPAFNPQFAWSGLRYFRMSIRANAGSVRIWDPKVAHIQMGDRQVDDFQFDVRRTENQRF
jgi:hypothetical protein